MKNTSIVRIVDFYTDAKWLVTVAHGISSMPSLALAGVPSRPSIRFAFPFGALRVEAKDMRCWAKKLVVVLATGYVLFFFSERVFWSFLRPGDKIAEIVLGWLVYSLLAWGFLLIVRQYRIASFDSVFLAGAVFGWLAEGVVVDALYGNSDKPFSASISFTGLAWHALISVGVGWYAQAKVLRAGRPSGVALFSVGVGLGWALWAGWWPAELGRANTSLASFAAHTGICFIPLCASWVILGVVRAEWFQPGKFELPVFLGLVALFFVGVRIPGHASVGADFASAPSALCLRAASEPHSRAAA
jgi:hypothetical protein